VLVEHLCIAPYAPFASLRDVPPRSSSCAPLRSPPKGASRAVRTRYRSPMPAPKCLLIHQSEFQKPDQTLCHFEKWRKTGQRGGRGMGAAHRSPTQPPEGRSAARGGEDRGEGCTRSLQAGKAPRSSQTGVWKAKIPPAPPPALLEPESVSLTARPSSPFERAPAFALSPGKTGESGAPQARILSSRSLLSFPFPTRL
jgi:hypothetical protein